MIGCVWVSRMMSIMMVFSRRMPFVRVRSVAAVEAGFREFDFERAMFIPNRGEFKPSSRFALARPLCSMAPPPSSGHPMSH
jgi:hypothetical protein